MSVKQPRNRNESAEGAGNARGRWFRYLSSLDPRTLDISGFLNMTTTVWQRYGDQPVSDAEAYYAEKSAQAAKEFAELVGFWVSWHLAGGFDLLEDRGWNRATIYRRIKRFRECFGVHPDEFSFDWLELDAEKCWDGDLETLVGQYTNSDDED